jgi:hypothetical protein
MALVFPLASRQLAAKNVLNHTAPQNQTLKLFSNDYTPVSATVVADLTETTGGGYASKSLTGSSWTIGDDGVDDALASYAEQTWTFTGTVGGTGIIYGYYVIQATSGLLLYAERLSSSYTPAVNGDALAITPKIRFGDLG